jgi:hypothetical protein
MSLCRQIVVTFRGHCDARHTGQRTTVTLPVRPSVGLPYLNGIHYINKLNISCFIHIRITSFDSTFSFTPHALQQQKTGALRPWSSHRDKFYCRDVRYSCHPRNAAQIFESLLKSTQLVADAAGPLQNVRRSNGNVAITAVTNTAT